VHCAQTAEDINTISFAYNRSMSLLDHFRILFISVNPFLPKFGPEVTRPLFTSAYSMANAVEWLEIAQCSQWRANRKPPSFFRMVPSLTPYTTAPSPKWGVQNAPQDQLRDASCQLANMIEDIDKAAVCCVG